MASNARRAILAAVPMAFMGRLLGSAREYVGKGGAGKKENARRIRRASLQVF